MNVHSSFVYNREKLKTTQMSINVTEYANMFYPYNEILLRQKKNELLKHVKTWMNLKTIMLSERHKI